MNLSYSPRVVRSFFKTYLRLRGLLPKRNSRSFRGKDSKKGPAIERIYVINLDREVHRWSKMENELRRISNSSGDDLLNMTVRHSATNAIDFRQEPVKNDDVDPVYTLADQLFVEPQPLVLPSRLELDAPIRMSRAEVAIARSHIDVWRRFLDSGEDFALVLEDDTWFHPRFATNIDRVWREAFHENKVNESFDVLYLSYNEVKHGAPKNSISNNLFCPVRGLWHLSGYIVSRRGAEKLLHLLPCQGPVDLWINHKFYLLDVLATKRPLISQRRDILSSNSYSVLPALTTIGAINSEQAALFHYRPSERPVFVFGPEASGHTSLAMALLMLGYRCCSDLEGLPKLEHERLFHQSGERVFDAYVNIGSLEPKIGELRRCYPRARFIFTSARSAEKFKVGVSPEDESDVTGVAILETVEPDKWRVLCEYLRCAPPTCSYPELADIGRRPMLGGSESSRPFPAKICKHDDSRWIVESLEWWHGVRTGPSQPSHKGIGMPARFTDNFEQLDNNRWILRSDTFTDNLSLFRPSNVVFTSEIGASLSVRREHVGVREYTGGSLSSRNLYLYGRFEATLRASNVPGVVTGFFLHRNSPRQEIDVGIAGNRPSNLLVNVFFNPGDEGANYDYGYRGTPYSIDLGFDSSTSSHRYAIEWYPHEIRWFVDDVLVHRRAIWDPTPIPHLPMTLHINSWLSRSKKLAGRIRNRKLPATTKLRSIHLDANSVSQKSIAADTKEKARSWGFSNTELSR